MTATKNVAMIDRSGDQIVMGQELRAKLNLQPWGELKGGNRRDLPCEDLLVLFDAPVKDAANAKAKSPTSAAAEIPTIANPALLNKLIRLNALTRIPISAVCSNSS